MSVAREILNQIKAFDRFALPAWGAKDFVALSNEGGIRFKTSGLCKWKGFVTVKYDHGSDLYNLEFGRVRKYEYKVDKTYEGVYCDQLVELIDGIVK